MLKSTLNKSGHIPFLLFLTGGVLLLFSPLLGENTLFFRDLQVHFFPMKVFLEKCWNQGTFPFWMPLLSCGTPFFADIQSGVFYPPSLFFYLIPMPLGFNLYILFHYMLGALFLYALTRLWGLSRAAACLSAASFTFGGYLVSMANVLNNLQAAIWLPAIFYCLEKCRSRHHRFWILMTAVAFAVQFLAGEPQLLILTAVLGFSHYLVVRRSETWPRHTMRTCGVLAVAGFVACCLTAVQLTATWEMITHSIRVSGFTFEEATRFSFSPSAFIRVLSPPRFNLHLGSADTDWVLSPYLGIIPLLFAMLSLWRLKDRRIGFWWFGLLIGLLLAFGKHTPLYGICFKYIPFFNAFRFPEKFFFMVAFSISFLAGFGFDAFRDNKLTSRKHVITTISIFGLILFSAASWKITGWADVGEIIVSPLFLAILILAPACLIIFTEKRVGRASFTMSILILCATDLIISHIAVNPVVPYRFYTERPERATSILEQKVEGRIFVDRPSLEALWPRSLSPFDTQVLWRQFLFPATGTLYGFSYVDGISGAETHTQWLITEMVQKLAPEKRLRFLALCGVHHVITENHGGEDPDSYRNMTRVNQYLYRFSSPLPEAYMVPGAQVSPSREEALEAALHASFSPLESVIVEKETQPADTDGKGGIVHSLSRRAANTIQVHVESRGGYLVVLDAYYPGWKATVDGQHREVVRTNGLFKGLYLEPGPHNVVFTFRPTGFTWSLAISIVTLAAVFLGLLRWRPGASPACSPSG